MTDILFICKRNDCYGFKSYTRRSSGLYNSTRFIVESLISKGIKAEIIEVIDNNCIDREVTKCRPRVVVVEALWVVPEKFEVLKKLHPNVLWFVHMHSGMSFLAQEGPACDWLRRYPQHGVGIIANSQDTFDSFKELVPRPFLTFLPNVYLPEIHSAKSYTDCFVVNVGCFGAIRPLKNQLVQAIAAFRWARENKRFLRFHVNASRLEVGGEPVLRNLEGLFKEQPSAELVKHSWYEPIDFIETFRKEVDISMQLSLSETFNVVSADAVSAGLPIVVSDEVKWASSWSKSDTEDIDEMVKCMSFALNNRWLIKRNQKKLLQNSLVAQKMWFNFVKDNA